MSVHHSMLMAHNHTASISFMPDFMSAEAAREYLHILLDGVGWRHDYVRVYGRNHPAPRLHQ
jgi:hypothetical protein